MKRSHQWSAEASSADSRLNALLLAHCAVIGVASLAIAASGSALLPEMHTSAGAVVGLGATVIWCYWSWQRVGCTATNPYVWFLSATVLYNAALPLLGALGLNNSAAFDETRFRAGIIPRTVEYVALSLLFLHLGALLGARRGALCAKKIECQDDSSLVQAGWILFALSIVPAIVTVKDRIHVVMERGYFALYQQQWITGADRAGAELATFLTPAVVFLLFGRSNSRCIRLLAVLVVAGQSLSGLLIGSRSAGVFPVVALGWAWHRTIREISPRAIALALLVFFAIVSPVVEATRDIEGASRSSLEFWLASYTGLNSPALKGISTQGETVRTVAHTIDLVPSSKPFEWGASYCTAALAVFPNIGWRQHPAAQHGSLSTWLVKTVEPGIAAVGGGLGYSYIAEAYINFGWFGPLVVCLVGFAMVRWLSGLGFSNRVEKAAAFAVILPVVLTFSRSESYDLFRPLVWHGLVPFMLVVGLRWLKGRRSPSQQ